MDYYNESEYESDEEEQVVQATMKEREQISADPPSFIDHPTKIKDRFHNRIIEAYTMLQNRLTEKLILKEDMWRLVNVKDSIPENKLPNLNSYGMVLGYIAWKYGLRDLDKFQAPALPLIFGVLFSKTLAGSELNYYFKNLANTKGILADIEDREPFKTIKNTDVIRYMFYWNNITKRK